MRNYVDVNLDTQLRIFCYDYHDLYRKWVRAIILAAVAERFRQLCRERDISYTELARLAGVTPSTVYSMLKPSRKDVGVVTVKILCDGLELSMIDFFDCELFRDLLPEIE